jgi:DNA-binding transcriptional ArsR family regulator
MSSFEPSPFVIVDAPEQLKAFTDPLRVRVLAILAREAATNQQLAARLGEPHAKVLHHVRALLDMSLIQLVDTRIKGGNVEKYYRAVARLFGLRPPPEMLPDITGAAFEIVRQEVEASAALWPEHRIDWERRTARLSPERAEEFRRRLLELIAEYWGGPPDRTAIRRAPKRSGPRRAGKRPLRPSAHSGWTLRWTTVWTQ